MKNKLHVVLFVSFRELNSLQNNCSQKRMFIIFMFIFRKAIYPAFALVSIGFKYLVSLNVHLPFILYTFWLSFGIDNGQRACPIYTIV